jgi:hypothetical protein
MIYDEFKHIGDYIRDVVGHSIDRNSDEYHRIVCTGYSPDGTLCNHQICVERRKAEAEAYERKEARRKELAFRSALYREDLWGMEWVTTAQPNKVQEIILKAWNASAPLTISGQVGCGKTSGALMVFWREKIPPTLISASALGIVPFSRILECGRAEGLIVDDLGTENEAGLVNLQTILNARDQNRKPTLITTNLTPAELRSRYDERIRRRLGQILDLRGGKIFILGGSVGGQKEN